MTLMKHIALKNISIGSIEYAIGDTVDLSTFDELDIKRLIMNGVIDETDGTTGSAETFDE